MTDLIHIHVMLLIELRMSPNTFRQHQRLTKFNQYEMRRMPSPNEIPDWHQMGPADVGTKSIISRYVTYNLNRVSNLNPGLFSEL